MIKDEIKFLYMKMEKLDNALYKVYLERARERGKIWYPIEKSMKEPQNKRLECNYKTVDDKFKELK